MKLTDQRGAIMRGVLHGSWASKATWAQINRERKAVPFEAVCELAAVVVAKKLKYAKITGKPRMRIFPRKDRREEGHWYVLYAGRWFIRSKSWENLVRRAAYGPWSQMTHEREAFK